MTAAAPPSKEGWSKRAAATGQRSGAHLLAVQVLRAFAALAVVIYHAEYDAEAVAARAGLTFEHSELLPWMAGVDVFFVISGFIMVHASEELFGMSGAAGLFLTRRLIRIVPLYWAATLLFLASLVLLPNALNKAAPNLWQIVASFLFVPVARSDGLIRPVFSLGWTLNYEMFFYALFATALVLRRAAAVATVTATLVLLVIMGEAVHRTGIAAPAVLAFWSDPIVLEFALGMGLALLRAEGIRLTLLARTSLAAAGVLLLHLDLAQPDRVVVLPPLVAYGGPAALLVAAAALGHGATAGQRLERLMAALGDASYALYLVHPFIIRPLRLAVIAAGFAGIGAAWGYVALVLVASVLAALLVHRRFERPMMRRLRRWAVRAAPATISGATGPSPR
ncbi:acyltransferase family protein [Chelatococcus daeguensis]|uniref:acyltransferase family protein n=1 Tax=Chelatococcus daeguensis TaxID=444444 RepID=UPI0009F91F28|nr:acyltransferase [Chelatococcus daeguensis]